MRSLEREDVQRHRLVFPVLFFIKRRRMGKSVSTRPRNPSQKTRVYAYARASAAHRSAVQLSVSSRRDDEKNVFVRFLSIFREESSSESMRRRARRLHLKCRPKVERTTFRHSLIVAIAAPVRRASEQKTRNAMEALLLTSRPESCARELRILSAAP